MSPLSLRFKGRNCHGPKSAGEILSQKKLAELKQTHTFVITNVVETVEIGKVIKQRKPFDDEWTRAIVNIVYTGYWLQDQQGGLLKEYKINSQHYNIMRILRGRYPNCASPGEIKEVLLDKRGDLTRLLDKLVRMELVNREVNGENRRKVDLTITKKGLTVLDELHEKSKGKDAFKYNLDKEEANELSRLLDKLRG